MLNNLFPALTGAKWKKALESVRYQLTFDPVDLNAFLISVASARNACLHNGMQWEINNEMAKQCMLRIKDILDLYVALHNEFIPKCYHKTENADKASDAVNCHLIN